MYLNFLNRYRHRRSYSTRSETNDSVFKDTEVSKRRYSKQSSVPALKNSDSKVKHNRAKSTSSQHRNNSTVRRNNQNDKKEPNSSKKSNKRRTKSESTKTVVSPVTVTESKSSNDIQADSPSNDTPKNKRRSRQKAQHIHSDEIDKQSIHQSNTKLNGNVNYNSRSNSRATRRDYIDRQNFGREISVGRKPRREYIPSPKKYYSQSRHNSYSQEVPYHGGLRSNSRVQQYDSNKSVVMPQKRYSNGPAVRQTRYFNGPMVRHNSYNGQASLRQIDDNHHQVIRHNSYSNEPLPRQNSFYEGVISHRNGFSKGPTVRHEGYTSSRIFRPPPYRNGMSLQKTDEVN